MKVIAIVLGLLLLPTAICINSATALSPQGGDTVRFVGSPVVQTADQHSVTIVWNTNAPSSSRVMYGSDWPVCLLAASYRQVWQAIHEVLGNISNEQRNKVFGANAVRFYGLKI